MSRHIDELAVKAVEHVTGHPCTLAAAEELDKWFTEHWTNHWEPNGLEIEMYARLEYVTSAYFCYMTQSRAHAKQSAKWIRDHAPHVRTIVDVGAGIGATTALIAEELPDRTIFYSNLRDSQWEAAAALFEMAALPNIRMTEGTPASVGAQAVFAFEYMEHFKAPAEEAARLLTPEISVYVDVSSFQFVSGGHWSTYRFGHETVTRKQARRPFNAALRDLGFSPAQKVLPDCKAFWNQRPTVWVHPQRFSQQQQAQEATP